MNYNTDDLMPSELGGWPPSEADIQAMLEANEIDYYQKQKLDDLIAEELWREEVTSIPSPAELNPNLK